MWSALAALLGVIFRIIVGKPIEKTEKYNDVGREQPDDPDDAFTNSDW